MFLTDKALIERLTEFCKESSPGCVVTVRPSDVAGCIRLKITDGRATLIPDRWDHNISELAAKSPDELWGFLESISNKLVRRPQE